MDELKYIAAISGGPDSMAMLDKYKDKIIAVCNVNYKKRIDSDIDESIVRQYCSKNDIPCYVKVVSEEEYKVNENFQSLARKIRYEFFLEIAKKLNCYNILVAHNLNDHLETAYMQIRKKTKSLFLGIDKNSKYKSLNIYRPLLDIKKKELEHYCIINNIKYAIDSSNDKDIYERNVVRKIINGWNDNKIYKFEQKINYFNNYWELFRNYIDRLYTTWDKSNTALLRHSVFVQYYILYQWLKNNNVSNLIFNKIINLISFLETRSSKSYILGDNKILYVKNKVIWIK